MLTITGKALGRKKPLFTDWSVPIPPTAGDGASTLRDLIGHVVRCEVRAFKNRQQDRLHLRILSGRQIEEAAARGKVEMGASEVPLQEVNEEDAVATALQAFEDGLYLIVLDGAEQKDLDVQVFLQEDSRLTFIRLSLLAGG